MQVIPGVYLVNGAPYGRHQNGYIVKQENATILVDSPYDPENKDLRA